MAERKPGTTAVFGAVVWKERKHFVAECPEVGTVSQGKSVDDALANLREATELYLEEFPASPRGRPVLTLLEVHGAAAKAVGARTH